MNEQINGFIYRNSFIYLKLKDKDKRNKIGKLTETVDNQEKFEFRPNITNQYEAFQEAVCSPD